MKLNTEIFPNATHYPQDVIPPKKAKPPALSKQTQQSQDYV